MSLRPQLVYFPPLFLVRHNKVADLRAMLTAHRIATDAQNLRPRTP